MRAHALIASKARNGVARALAAAYERMHAGVLADKAAAGFAGAAEWLVHGPEHVRTLLDAD